MEETHKYKVVSLEATADAFGYTDCLLPLERIIEGLLIGTEVKDIESRLSFHVDDLEAII